MKSVLDDIPEGPAAREELAAALDRFIAERRLHLPALFDERLAAAVALVLERLSAWSCRESLDESHPAERLARTWVRRRLPALREACGRFQLFVGSQRASHPSWNLSHFIGNWFLAERHPAAAEAILIFEAIVSRTIEDQERLIGPAVKTVVRRIRALEKAAAALKAEIETRSAPSAPPFWAGVVEGMTVAVRHTMGDEAARATAANIEGRFPALAAPFLALVSVRPQWESLIAATGHLAAATVGAMQENFSSATLGSAHAPEKRGLRFRIGLLERAGFRPGEIAGFEGVTAEAVAEHLRRLGRPPGAD